MSLTGSSARAVRDAVTSRIWPVPTREVHFADQSDSASKGENAGAMLTTGLTVMPRLLHYMCESNVSLKCVYLARIWQH